MPGRIGELIPIVAIMCGAAMVIFVPLVRAFAKRIEHRAAGGSAAPELEARLERIEHSLESIAVEIERVSEGQRFTTKLLSEQKGRIESGGGDR